MAGYETYDRDHPRQIPRDEVVEAWDPRYFDSQGNLRDTSASSHSQLVPRRRHDTGYSAAEPGPRDFLVASDQDRDMVRRSRSSEPGGGYDHQDYQYHRSYGAPRHHEYPRHYDGDHEYEYRVRRSERYYDDDDLRSEPKTHHKHHRQHSSGLSTQDKIIAAVAGAALLAGGKELYDRHEAKEERTEVQRNPLASAALAGFGALAAYEGAKYYSKQQARRDRTANYILQRGRGDAHSESVYSSDNDEGYSSREKKGHKNFLESALAATGLAAFKGLAGAVDNRRTDTRSRGGSPAASRASSRSGRTGDERHRDHHQPGKSKIQQAAIASLLAGATEAFRVAKEPGSWKGEKTKRILTAAIGAATVDAAQGTEHRKLGLAEAVIGGLVGNRLLNGSRNNIEEDKITGRSRSRSRSRSQARPNARSGGGSGSGAASIAALATAGLGALAAKKSSSHRSKSRSRSGGRRGSDSRARGLSRGPSGDRESRSRSRSRSVVDKARDGLAKLGLGGSSVSVDNHRRKDGDKTHDREAGRSQKRHDRRHRHDDHRRGDRRAGSSGGSGYESDSDLGDSEDDRGSNRKNHRRH